MKIRETIENVRKPASQIAHSLTTNKHIFLTGAGLGHVVAMEGALKIKELTYVHC